MWVQEMAFRQLQTKERKTIMLKDLLNLIKKEEKLPRYEFVERKIDDEFVQVATKINSGPYKDVIFSVGGVSFREEGEEIKLNYQFRIESNPTDVDTSGIDTLIGDIIMDVLGKELEESID